MEPTQALELGKKSALKHAEIFVTGVINDCYDPALEFAKQELSKLIPGTIDDAIIAKVVENFGPVMKASLLAEVAKISAEV